MPTEIDSILASIAKPTTKAQLAVRKLIEDAGFTVTETKMIGAKLWIAAERKWITEKCPTGHFTLDESIYGCVGPRGKLELNLQAFLNNRTVTEPWHLRSVLTRREGHKSPAPATEAATA